MSGSEQSIRQRLYVVIFEDDTPRGQAFDIALLWAVLLSVLAVILESVESIHQHWGDGLRVLEWIFTLLFTVEYLLRLYCAPNRFKYVRSFFGLVDLVAILPTYVSLLVPGAQSMLVIRVLRLLRVFRVLKLASFLGEAHLLVNALRASMRKIMVFLFAVVTIVIIVGSTMYLIEGPEHGFTSIPRSMHWAVVTLTTVGYGNVTPQTPWGQTLSSLLMILGYGIIAVPTGIVTSEMSRSPKSEASREQAPEEQRGVCPGCGSKDHSDSARFCQHCGHDLSDLGRD